MEVGRLDKQYQQVVATALSVRCTRQFNVLQQRGESIEKIRYKGVTTRKTVYLCAAAPKTSQRKEIFQAPGGE